MPLSPTAPLAPRPRGARGVRGSESAALASRMMRSALGPVVSVITLVALPLLGRLFLGDDAFAFWALLATVGTAAVVVDLGGPLHVAATLARPEADHAGALRRALCYSVAGSGLVTLVALLAWVPYVELTRFEGVSAFAGLAALAAMGGAAAIRSTGAVAAAAALAYEDFRLRTWVLAAQAVCTLAITLGLLVAGLGFWALPLGTAVGGGVPGVWGLFALHRRHPQLRHGEGMSVRGEARTLASVRLQVAALSLALTQADRWVVGAIGGPSLLAQYEVAWRLAVLPKLGVLALAVILIPDAARVRGEAQALIAAQARRATRVTAVLLMVGALLTGGIAALAIPQLAPSGTGLVTGLFLLLLLGHCVHSLTAPGTMIANGLGRPRAEIGYLVLAFGVAMLGWTAAALLDLPLLATAAAVIGLVVGSTYFLLTRPYLRDPGGQAPPSPAVVGVVG